MIYPDFSLALTKIFQGKPLIQFLANKILFNIVALSFLTLNKFTQSFKSPSSRIWKLHCYSKP